jgi:GT2 family glycosyltransferase
MQPEASITIVLFNSEGCLRACLRSIRAGVEAGRFEVLVVDNASPDRSAATVATELPQARLLRSDTNRGFAGGCNISWPEVQGRYWVLLNPDVVVPEGGLDILVRWMDAHPGHGIASPELVDSVGRSQSAARRFPTIWRALLELSRLHLLTSKRLRESTLLGAYRGSTGDCLDADWVPATAPIVRPQAVRDVGLLSETLPMYAEDSEWCWRFGQRGWRVGVCAETRFTHDEGTCAVATWGQSSRELNMWRGIYASCTHRQGATRARVLACVNLVAFALEAVIPGRSTTHRQRLQHLVGLHRELLRRRVSAGRWP